MTQWCATIGLHNYPCNFFTVSTTSNWSCILHHKNKI